MNKIEFKIRFNDRISSFVFSFDGKELVWGSYKYDNYRLRNNYGAAHINDLYYEKRSTKHSKAKRIIKRLDGIG